MQVLYKFSIMLYATLYINKNIYVFTILETGYFDKDKLWHQDLWDNSAVLHLSESIHLILVFYLPAQDGENPDINR